MRRIFICYRRDDSQGYVGWIRTHLIEYFGAEAIFQDITGIPPGKNVRKYIGDAVKDCKVMLVLIDSRWLRMTDKETGELRLDQPGDPVRLEIVAALENGLTVIPMLLGGTRMPHAHDLPEVLRPLTELNAYSINPIIFDANMQRLIDWLEEEEGIEPLAATPGDAIERDSAAQAPSVAVGSRDDSEEIISGDGSVEAATLIVLEVLPPPFAWVEIPAGQVTLEEDMATYQVERFVIAKYPVTNAQYQVFVDAPDGYENPGWWDYSTDAQWWRDGNAEPHWPAWGGPPNEPRVKVTWFEAVAFCRWLGDRVRYDVRLPAETEWQRAAQGDDGPTYPWGNEEPDERRANWNHDVGKTTPVGSYPDGASPYGVLDMAGNVWEWCATDYETGNNDIERLANYRVLRGGSWFNSASYLRVAYRAWDMPEDWSYLFGFRCARAFDSDF